MPNKFRHLISELENTCSLYVEESESTNFVALISSNGIPRIPDEAGKMY